MTGLEAAKRLFETISSILKSPDWNPRYRQALKSDVELTKFISNMNAELAPRMKMVPFREYYTIDHVLYQAEDRIPEGELPFGTSWVKGTWLKRIRVAFEHENHLDKAGGFQEIAKLILFNADMKVLMGWADQGENYDEFAREYQQIYKSASSQKTITPILFIGEYSDTRVDAYLLTPSGILKHDETEGWNAI